MKKSIKRIIATLVVLFALIGAGGVTAFAANYIQWNGTSAYENILITLEQIKTKGQGLKSERDTYKGSNEQLANQIKDKENIIKDKDNLINAKTQENDALKKDNDKLKESSTNEANKLKQAEMGMEDVGQKSKDVLNSLN